MSVEPIPERYHSAVIPHIMVDGASDAIEFYAQAYGATELFRITSPKGKIIHAEMRIGQSVFMIGDPDGSFRDAKSLGASSVGLHVYIDDVDTLFSKATNAGARILQPVQTMFYGDRTTMLEDPYGHVWVFLTHQEDLTPEEIVERAKAAFAQ